MVLKGMKILVVGRSADYNAEYFYLKALRRMGHAVVLIDEYDGMKYGTLNRYIQSRTRVFDFIRNTYSVNRHITAYCNSFQPDIILVFKGEFLSSEVLKEISENFKVYLFWPDTYKFIPLMSERLHIFNAVFTAANNVEFYRNLGAKKVVTVPWACDPEFHRKLDTEYRYNVTFIGTAYLERRRIIKSLSNVNVFGDYWFGFKYRHPAVVGNDYIKTINETKINLNLQAEVSVRADAPTMRTFELAGCEGFQISDYMPSVTKYLPGIVTFRNLEELKELIPYYLENGNEREEISAKLQARCYKDYTYEASAGIILSNV